MSKRRKLDISTPVDIKSNITILPLIIKRNHCKRSFDNFLGTTGNQYGLQSIKKQNTCNYICCIHDNCKEICSIYDCSGIYQYNLNLSINNSDISKLPYIT